MEIIVASGFGIETATRLELRTLGILDAKSYNGRFIFDGTIDDVVNCNLKLRTADRVLIRLGHFNAISFDELFDNTSAICWEDYLQRDSQIIVNAKSIDSALFALSAIQSITKKAIVERLKHKYNSLPEDGEPYKIEVAIIKDEVTIALDTSGDGLHKRGYRDLVGEAPLKETIAAAIIKLSVWNPDRPLIDAFTGSGTIPIEAAMVALNMPSGLNRNFLLEKYTNIFPTGIMKRAQEEARQQINWDRNVRIAGYDIDKKAIQLAVHHAENLGLEKYIHFETNDMRNISSRYKYGVIISNPPYGERLVDDPRELRDLYRDFGKMYRSLDGWSLYAITSYPYFEHSFGAYATKNRKLYNARLECRLYQYLGPCPPKAPHITSLDNEPLL